MVDEQVRDDDSASDRPCGRCGHEGHQHLLREIEVAGNTVRETYCEACEALCEYVPAPEVTGR